jgi:eukaryotic-like serine/threonine-protein kinase
MELTPESARRLAGALFDDSDTESDEVSRGFLSPGPFGKYRLIRLLGVGGMGEVYEAEQESPSRRVAVKVIRPDLLSPGIVRRFEHETRVLARLQHPGIATVYEAGRVRLDEGLIPFFAMELIEGAPLTTFVRERTLSLRDRLELFLRICEAVEHAHRSGIIHRDLKPGNILIDPKGQPRVMDFGVARATDADVRTTSLHTEIGRIIGTLPYMSPEQIGGNFDAIDTRTDVYSLGVILYELLGGRLPYEIKAGGKGGLQDAARVIQEKEPPLLGSIDPGLRGDLETIARKALEKEPDRRYQSVTEFAADVRRYLTDLPIIARPPSALYQARKFARRNRTAAIALSVALASLVGSSVVSAVLAVRSVRAEHRAETAAESAKTASAAAETRRLESERARKRSEAVSKFLSNLLGAASAEQLGKDVKVMDAIKASESAKAELANEPETLAAVDLAIGRVYSDLGETDLAIAQFQSGLEALRTANLQESGGAAELLVSLAEAYEDAGNDQHAGELAKQAQELATRVEGPGSYDVHGARNVTASILRWNGHPEEAVAIWKEIHAEVVAQSGPDDEDALTYQNNLADALMALRRYDEAEAMIRDLVPRRTRVLGPENPHTLSSIECLANVLTWSKKFDEAEGLYQSVLASRRHLYGNAHPKVTTTLNNIAFLRERKGDYEGALPLFREAATQIEQLRGHDHPHTQVVRLSLGRTLYHLGKYEESEPILRDVYETRRRLFGDDSDDTMGALNFYSKALLATGKLAEAEALLGGGLEHARKTLRSDDFRIAAMESTYGGCLVEEQKFDLAEPVLLHSYQQLAKSFGERDEGTREAAKNLATLYDHLGRTAERDRFDALARTTPDANTHK